MNNLGRGIEMGRARSRGNVDLDFGVNLPFKSTVGLRWGEAAPSWLVYKPLLVPQNGLVLRIHSQGCDTNDSPSTLQNRQKLTTHFKTIAMNLQGAVEPKKSIPNSRPISYD